MKFLKQPYNLFLLAAITLFITSFFFREQSFDFHLHDTYFVVSAVYFFWFLVAVFLLSWALYKLLNRIMWTKYLTWFHVIATILVLIICMTASLWHDELVPPIKREYVSWQTIQEDIHREQNVYLWIAILFIAGQAAFVINLFGGLIRHQFSRPKTLA